MVRSLRFFEIECTPASVSLPQLFLSIRETFFHWEFSDWAPSFPKKKSLEKLLLATIYLQFLNSVCMFDCFSHHLHLLISDWSPKHTVCNPLELQALSFDVLLWRESQIVLIKYQFIPINLRKLPFDILIWLFIIAHSFLFWWTFERRFWAFRRIHFFKWQGLLKLFCFVWVNWKNKNLPGCFCFILFDKNKIYEGNIHQRTLWRGIKFNKNSTCNFFPKIKQYSGNSSFEKSLFHLHL